MTNVDATPLGDRGTEVIHQLDSERRADQRSAAESHDGHARRHAGPIRNHFINVETGAI